MEHRGTLDFEKGKEFLSIPKKTWREGSVGKRESEAGCVGSQLPFSIT